MNREKKFILTMVATTHPICSISNGKGSLEDIALKEPANFLEIDHRYQCSITFIIPSVSSYHCCTADAKFTEVNKSRWSRFRRKELGRGYTKFKLNVRELNFVGHLFLKSKWFNS